VALYGIFDSAGNCLYVGRSDRHPVERWREHADKPWFAEATEFRVLPSPTEARAIADWEPLHNIAGGSRALDPEGVMAQLDAIAFEIFRLQTAIERIEARIGPEIAGRTDPEGRNPSPNPAETR
jgi:hypothetical protein